MARSLGRIVCSTRFGTLVAGLAALASPSYAATLHPGDAVVLSLETLTPAVLRHVEIADGSIGTIVPTPSLSQPLDLVIRRDGAILVADVVLGIVAVDPENGAATVVASTGELGGGPSTLAFDPRGDLLVAGGFGVSRLARGIGPPVSLSGSGLLVRPRGITSDGGSNIWISDDQNLGSNRGQIVHLNESTGQQAVFATTCATNVFPLSPLAIRRGADGFLYVANGPYNGPGQYQNSGIFRVDAATGVATRWNDRWYLRGFDFGPRGDVYILFRENYHRDAYEGILGYDGKQARVLQYGPVAVVPSDVTPVRPSSWGAVKTRYR